MKGEDFQAYLSPIKKSEINRYCCLCDVVEHTLFGRIIVLQIYKNFWKNCINFSGVASRKEYWLSMLINYILTIVVALFALEGIRVNENISVVTIFACAWIVAVIIPTLSIRVRRLHDCNHSGWWVIGSFVPVLNIIVFVFTVLPSNPVNNKWVEGSISMVEKKKSEMPLGEVQFDIINER